MSVSRAFLGPVAGALLLAGCVSDEAIRERASPVMPRLMAAYEAAVPCCSSFQDLEYTPLFGATRQTFEISRALPAHRFASGKSFFKAFELPPRAQAFTITVQSTLPGTLVGDYSSSRSGALYNRDNSFILVPVVTLLDAEHRVTRTLAAESRFAEARRHFELSFQPSADERRLVVHTDPKYFGGSVPYRYLFELEPLPFAPEGQIRLVLEKRTR